jgi:hypothetical protein
MTDRSPAGSAGLTANTPFSSIDSGTGPVKEMLRERYLLRRGEEWTGWTGSIAFSIHPGE